MASACSSEYNTEKSCTTCSNVSYPRGKAVSDTHCSSNTRCYLRRKKPINPLAMPLRPPINSNVRQRVASAKLSKIRALQSQLNDANFHLMELAQENRALKATQRRQDRALNTYEGVNADLPRLMKSHEEENRVLIERNRTMKRQIRELTDLVKLRDEELLNVKDQLKHLNMLAKDKQLMERDELQRDLFEARDLIKKYESDISILNRKVALETKNCRQRVNAEIYKYKKCQEELAHAIEEVDRQGEQKGKLLRRRFDVSPLAGRRSTPNIMSPVAKDTPEADGKGTFNFKRVPNESRASITSPVQNIKARLRAPTEIPSEKGKTVNDILDQLDKEEQLLKKSLNGRLTTKAKPTRLETLIQNRSSTKHMQKLSTNAMNEEVIGKQKDSNADNSKLQNGHTNEHTQRKSMFQEHDLKNSSDEHKNIQPVKKRANQEDAIPDNDYNNAIIDNDSISDCENAVREHYKQLKESEAELMKVRAEVEEMANVDANENRDVSEAGRFAGLFLEEEDYNLVNEIWTEEYTFRKLQRDKAAQDNGALTDENKPKKDPIVILESKQKLLAALNEIDNTKSNEFSNNELDLQPEKVIENEKKTRFLQEIFGSG